MWSVCAPDDADPLCEVSGGEIALGQWQRVLMAERDGPRARTRRVQVQGIV